MRKFFLGSILTLLIVCLTGCGTASVTTNIERTMTRLQNTLNTIQNITNEQIITTDIVETSTTSSYLNRDVAFVQGNAYNVPNYNRNTDTYGNGFYGVGARYGGYMGGYGGYGYPPMPGYGGYGAYGGYGGYGPGNGYGYGSGYNGNGYVGTNIDTYRENINESNGRNYPKMANGGYGYGGYGYGMPYGTPYNQPIPPQTSAPAREATAPSTSRIKNINTYKDIKTNINSYKHANVAETPEVTINRTALDNHYSRLTSLCQIQEDVMGCNNDCNNLKTQILGNISYILTMSKEIKAGNIHLSDNQVASINDLLNNITSQTSKLNLGKNELNTELAHVKSLKTNYSANMEELSSKYIRLLNCLDSRCTNYQNILVSLYQIQNILNNNQNYCYPYCNPNFDVNNEQNNQNYEEINQILPEEGNKIDENYYPAIEKPKKVVEINEQNKKISENTDKNEEKSENYSEKQEISNKKENVDKTNTDKKINKYKINRVFVD